MHHHRVFKATGRCHSPALSAGSSVFRIQWWFEIPISASVSKTAAAVMRHNARALKGQPPVNKRPSLTAGRLFVRPREYQNVWSIAASYNLSS